MSDVKFACLNGTVNVERDFALEASGLVRSIAKDLGSVDTIEVPFTMSAAAGGLRVLWELPTVVSVLISDKSLEFLRFIQCRVEFTVSPRGSAEDAPRCASRIHSSFIRCPGMLKRLHEAGNAISDETFRSAATRGSLSALKYIAGVRPMCANICRHAGKWRHIEFLHGAGAPLCSETLSCAIMFGRLDVVRYHLSHGIAATAKHVERAIRMDQLECLKELGVPVDRTAVITAIECGSWKCLEYLARVVPIDDGLIMAAGKIRDKEHVALICTDHHDGRWWPLVILRRMPEMLPLDDLPREKLEALFEHAAIRESRLCTREIAKRLTIDETHLKRVVHLGVKTFAAVSANAGITEWSEDLALFVLEHNETDVLRYMLDHGHTATQVMLERAEKLGNTMCAAMLLRRACERTDPMMVAS